MKWLFSLFGRSRSETDDLRLERYKHFRELGRKINTDLARQLPKPAVPECGKKLGLVKSGTLILNQDDEIALLYDYCVHHYRRVGKNWIERALENSPSADGSDEMAYFQAMISARFSLFRIVEIIPHEGAQLLDMLSGGEARLMDIGLASAAVPGLLVAGRLLTLEDFQMSSGTLIPVAEPVFEELMKPVIQKFLPDGSTPGSSELSPAQAAAFEAQILRIAIHQGGEDISFYTDMEA